MTKSYQPANGTEGECFQEAYCSHCARDAAFRDTGYEGDPALGCPILGRTMLHNPGDADYPEEWICDDDYRNARCTAYTGDPSCPTRCKSTPDLFL